LAIEEKYIKNRFLPNKIRISSESRNESSELIHGSRSRGAIGEKVDKFWFD